MGDVPGNCKLIDIATEMEMSFLTKYSLLTTPEAIKMTTTDAASDENSSKYGVYRGGLCLLGFFHPGDYSTSSNVW